MSYKCFIDDCIQEFDKRLELKHHLIFYHNKHEATYICPIETCHKKFDSVKKLREHEKTHADIQCNICGNKFVEEKYLMTHMKIHDENREKFKCEQCSKEFFHRYNLKVHIQSKHQNVTFKCVYCGKVVKSQAKLDYHKKRQHKNEDLFISVDEFNENLLYENEDESKQSDTISTLSEQSEPKSVESVESKFLFSDNIELTSHFELNLDEFSFLDEICD